MSYKSTLSLMNDAGNTAAKSHPHSSWGWKWYRLHQSRGSQQEGRLHQRVQRSPPSGCLVRENWLTRISFQPAPKGWAGHFSCEFSYSTTQFGDHFWRETLDNPRLASWHMLNSRATILRGNSPKNSIQLWQETNIRWHPYPEEKQKIINRNVIKNVCKYFIGLLQF